MWVWSQIEKKLLESAEGLLAAGKTSDGRSLKMVDAIHLHKDKIQFLSTQIAEEGETEGEVKGHSLFSTPLYVCSGTKCYDYQ